MIGGAGAAIFGTRSVWAASEDPELNVPNLRAAYEPWRSWRAPGIYSKAPASLSGDAQWHLGGDAQWHPTFAFRVGWPTRPGVASRRRSLASVVMPPNRADGRPTMTWIPGDTTAVRESF